MKFFTRFKKHTKDEDGAAMILLALMLVILMGFAALAFDYGIVYYRQSQLQSAVDIAARAASRKLVDVEEDTTMTTQQKEDSIREVIQYYLKENGFPEDKLKVCDIGIDINTGISIDARSAVELNFARIFTDKPMPIAAGTTAKTDVEVTKGKKATVDVVFILDVSSSMYKSSAGVYYSRFVPMVEAVNECVNLIMKENPENRVGIVTYGHEDATQVILNMTDSPLNSCAPDGYTYLCPNYLGYSATKSNGKPDTTGQPYRVSLVTKDGVHDITSSGTYIQYGVAKGANMLYELAESEITNYGDRNHRFPAVFILTDGEGTKGNRNWDTTNVGNTSTYRTQVFGSSANEDVLEVSYYTILTANYWKDKLTDVYTRRNKEITGVDEVTKCRVYTLGFMMSGVDDAREDMARGLLRPQYLDEEYSSINSYARELRADLQDAAGWVDCLRDDDKSYYYVDKYYDAENGDQLADLLVEFANDVVAPTRKYKTRLTR